MENIMTAKIAVAAATYAIDRPYDYILPEKYKNTVLPGVRVTVPFGKGNRRCEGIVLSVSESEANEKLKSIENVLDDTPVLLPEQIKLALWMRDRFFCTVYDAVRVMLPNGMWYKDGTRKVGDKLISTACLKISAEEAAALSKAKRIRAPQQASVLELLSAIGSASVKEICYFTGASSATVKMLEKQDVVVLEQTEVFRRPTNIIQQQAEPIVLNNDQQTAFDGLSELLDIDKADVALLFGVTGSGKTSVYIKLIEKVLKKGKSAIVLVPEIALTPQLVNIFSAHFGEDVAVLHSSLGMGERYDEWKRIRREKVHVIVGTRSAVFAPVSDLGLIIVDEDQEHTYKSENSPRYHARDVAKYRCVQSDALLLLGSATPAVESMYSAKTGKYKLFEIYNRFNMKDLPEVIISDMKEELKNGNGSTIGSVLEREIHKNIAAGEQTILFINRRGSANFIVCGECGFTYTCPRCSVSMTYHSANHRLMCHYCGISHPLAENCPECGGKLKHVGAGTQKVQEELHELLPDIEILRMDTDTVSASGSHERILSQFRDKKIPILVGTQMVTKGLDFENVTLVGVISADQSLYVNDYRANERTFSLITQVVGRSGRGDKAGRAVIQTFTPLNEVIRLSSRQDYMGFYEREIRLREIMGSPPIADLFMVTVSGANEDAVLRACIKLRNSFENYFSDIGEMNILGPASAVITKINNRYRYRISLSCKNSKKIRDTLSHIMREFSNDKLNRGLSVHTDINPLE